MNFGLENIDLKGSVSIRIVVINSTHFLEKRKKGFELMSNERNHLFFLSGERLNGGSHIIERLDN